MLKEYDPTKTYIFGVLHFAIFPTSIKLLVEGEEKFYKIWFRFYWESFRGINGRTFKTVPKYHLDKPEFEKYAWEENIFEVFFLIIILSFISGLIIL